MFFSGFTSMRRYFACCAEGGTLVAPVHRFLELFDDCFVLFIDGGFVVLERALGTGLFGPILTPAFAGWTGCCLAWIVGDEWVL